MKNRDTSKRIRAGILISFAAMCVISPIFAQNDLPKPIQLPTGCPNKTLVGRVKDNAKFKIKIDTAVTSGSNRVGDFVQFSVLEDVPGIASNDYFKESIVSELDTGAKPTTQVKCELVVRNGGEYVAIPKDTKAFGRVYSRRGRSPFWIRGKAQIFVQINQIKFRGGDPKGSGDMVNIRFANAKEHTNLLPCDRTNRKDAQRGKVSKMNFADELCIEGRRPSLGFGNVIASPLLAAWLGVAKDDLSYPVAGITFLDKAASGLADFLNGTTAEISDKLIFEVELVSPIP